MSDAPPKSPAPRIEAEPIAAPRLEPTALVPLAPEPRLPPRVPLTIAGVLLLVLGLPALWTADLVPSELARAPVLGWLTLAVAIAGFRPDRHRASCASCAASSPSAPWTTSARSWRAGRPGVSARRRGAGCATCRMAPPCSRPWRRSTRPNPCSPCSAPGPARALREQAEALGRNAALQSAAIIAAMPSPALDVLAVGWRGIRLVRQVAALHGMRPGLLGHALPAAPHRALRRLRRGDGGGGQRGGACRCSTTRCSRACSATWPAPASRRAA